VTARRFPASVYDAGGEPDVRFSLANERTFLAWIRTALALLAGGVALEALAAPLQPTLRLVASLVLVLTGMVLAGQAWFGWMRTERAIRLEEPLPGPVSALPTAIGVVVAAALVTVAILVGPA
jgi:putative membrane protein